MNNKHYIELLKTLRDCIGFTHLGIGDQDISVAGIIADVCLILSDAPDIPKEISEDAYKRGWSEGREDLMTEIRLFVDDGK